MCPGVNAALEYRRKIVLVVRDLEPMDCLRVRSIYIVGQIKRCQLSLLLVTIECVYKI